MASPETSCNSIGLSMHRGRIEAELRKEQACSTAKLNVAVIQGMMATEGFTGLL